MNLKEVKAEIRRRRKEMKEQGIKRSSFMNGGHTPTSYRYNAELFRLNVEVDKLEKEEAEAWKKLPPLDPAHLEGLKKYADDLAKKHGQQIRVLISREKNESGLLFESNVPHDGYEIIHTTNAQ